LRVALIKVKYLNWPLRLHDQFPASNLTGYNTLMNSAHLDNQILLTYLTRHLDQYLADLRTLTAVDSGTQHKPGVDAVQDWMQARLEALGFTCQRDRQPVLGDNLSGDGDRAVGGQAASCCWATPTPSSRWGRPRRARCAIEGPNRILASGRRAT
jgi:hypothetical protein